MTEILESFSPIVSNRSKILILGSMPGAESLRKQQYYGHRRNQFWKILFMLFEAEWTESYEDRINFLHDNKIALWDVFQYCERKGSLDQNIHNEVLNDFVSFLSKYSRIERIFCNGSKAYNSFNKFFPSLRERYQLQLLPSSSPAYTIKLEDKMEKWSILRV